MIAPISPPEVRRRQAALFEQHAADAAAALIGWTLTVDGEAGPVGGRIVETEAYDRLDPASHSFSGQTPRNAVMFGPPGFIYVYRSYGIHWCLNLVCGGAPRGAVLIRALEPTVGIAQMQARRGTQDLRLLASGPGRVGQALAVTGAHNGLSATAPPFDLIPGAAAAGVVAGPRIGITKAAEIPWRFGEKGSRFVSRPFK